MLVGSKAAVFHPLLGLEPFCLKSPPLAATAQGLTSRPAFQEALPFELVENEHAHREESDDQEDRHCPVATSASQPLRTCKGSSWWSGWGASLPSPGLLGQGVVWQVLQVWLSCAGWSQGNLSPGAPWTPTVYPWAPGLPSRR